MSAKPKYTTARQEQFVNDLDTALGEIRSMLIAKNRKYGNSVLQPVRAFSKASPREQLLVRIDDKISRLLQGDPSDTEDPVTDATGYLVLLRVLDLVEARKQRARK